MIRLIAIAFTLGRMSCAHATSVSHTEALDEIATLARNGFPDFAS
jgi:hypothetical protein